MCVFMCMCLCVFIRRFKSKSKYNCNQSYSKEVKCEDLGTCWATTTERMRIIDYTALFMLKFPLSRVFLEKELAFIFAGIYILSLILFVPCMHIMTAALWNWSWRTGKIIGELWWTEKKRKNERCRDEEKEVRFMKHSYSHHMQNTLFFLAYVLPPFAVSFVCLCLITIL